MELVVENLGRIRSAAIDLRPLTVFVGPSNANKSWTAYAAYRTLSTVSVLGRSWDRWAGDERDWFDARALRAMLETLVEGEDPGRYTFERSELLRRGSRTVATQAAGLGDTIGADVRNATATLHLTADEVSAGPYPSGAVLVQRDAATSQTTLVLEVKGEGRFAFSRGSRIEASGERAGARTPGSQRGRCAITERPAGSSHDDRATSGVVVRSSREETGPTSDPRAKRRGWRTKTMRAGDDQRGRCTMIARTAGPTYDHRDQRGRRTIIGRPAGP